MLRESIDHAAPARGPKLRRVGLLTGWIAVDARVIIFSTIKKGLQRVSANGGTPSPVTTPDASTSEIDHHAPKILPDGRTLLFTIHAEPGVFRIGALDLSTGRRKTLIESGFDPSYVSSGHLVYGSGRTLRAVPFDIGRAEVAGSSIKLLDDVATDPGNGYANYSVSANGTLTFGPDPDRNGRRLDGPSGKGNTFPDRAAKV